MSVPLSAVKGIAVYRKDARKTKTLVLAGSGTAFVVLSYVAVQALVSALGNIEIEIANPFDFCPLGCGS